MLESKFTLHPKSLHTSPCLDSHWLCGSADNSGRDSLILPFLSSIPTYSTGSWEQEWLGLLSLRQPPHMLSCCPVTPSSQCWSDKFAWVLPVKAYTPCNVGWMSRWVTGIASSVSDTWMTAQTTWQARGFVGVLGFFPLSGADGMSSLRSLENQSGPKRQTPDSSSASKSSSFTSKVGVTGITAVTC